MRRATNHEGAIVSCLVVGMLLAPMLVSGRQAPMACNGPLAFDRLVRLLSEGVTPTRVVFNVKVCGVDFDLTAESERVLRAVNATDAVIRAVREAARKRTTAPGGSAAARVATDGLEIKWARIRAGTFEMGCTAGDQECLPVERPRHRVTISRAFELMTTEVTLGMYRARAPVPTQPAWNNGIRQPVVNVTWEEAHAFCTAIRGRLPTEAEWEYGARGGRSDWRYPWGNEASAHRANYSPPDSRDRTWEHTAPVASFAPNAFGLYDIAGNVLEWVADWNTDRYDDLYYARSPATDPIGPSSGNQRVLRGGCWTSLAQSIRVSDRGYSYEPTTRLDNVGFRCARDASP